MSELPDDLTTAQIIEAFAGKTIAHVVPEQNERVQWVGLTFTDGSEIELQAVWCNDSSADLSVTKGRRIRDIYKYDTEP